jgi:hypothetical protein
MIVCSDSDTPECVWEWQLIDHHHSRLQIIKDCRGATGFAARPSLAQIEIDAIERNNKVVLPRAMRQLHEFMDGMMDGQTGEAGMNIWPLWKTNSVPTVLWNFRGIPA